MRLALLVVAGCGRIGFGELAATGADAPPVDGFSKLAVYADQTCALFHGNAYCWGANGAGQLGDGTMTDAHAPVRVQLPAGTVDDITQGESHGCAIVDAAPYCFGTLGTPAPVRIGGTAQNISAGRDFTCMIESDGEVSCWGFNDVGQLGDGTTQPRTQPTLIAYNGPTLASIEVGDDHACANDVLGTAVCWGHNDFGTLGNPSAPAMSATPVTVALNPIEQPQIAGWHACALRATGTVMCWGEGDHGELGDGGTASASSPQQVPGLSNVTAIATGGGPTDLDASCAISGGVVSCWGNGMFGRLGQGSASSSGVPVEVVGLPGPATSVAIGYDHACALLADGELWCWGRGDHGQLGDGRGQSSLQPVRVMTP